MKNSFRVFRSETKWWPMTWNTKADLCELEYVEEDRQSCAEETWWWRHRLKHKHRSLYFLIKCRIRLNTSCVHLYGNNSIVTKLTPPPTGSLIQDPGLPCDSRSSWQPWLLIIQVLWFRLNPLWMAAIMQPKWVEFPKPKGVGEKKAYICLISVVGINTINKHGIHYITLCFTLSQLGLSNEATICPPLT